MNTAYRILSVVCRFLAAYHVPFDNDIYLITKDGLSVVKWLSEYGSIGCGVTQSIHLKLANLPCSLNSAPIIEYILSPFALVRTHGTITNDISSDLGSTMATYKCTEWCVIAHVIPTLWRVKMLPSYLTD